MAATTMNLLITPTFYDDVISPAVEVLVAEPKLRFQCCGTAKVAYKTDKRRRREGDARYAYGYERPCEAKTVWEIDGQFYCQRHTENFWKSHFVDEHRVTRLYDEDLQEALELMHVTRVQQPGLHRIK